MAFLPESVLGVALIRSGMWASRGGGSRSCAEPLRRSELSTVACDEKILISDLCSSKRGGAGGERDGNNPLQGLRTQTRRSQAPGGKNCPSPTKSIKCLQSNPGRPTLVSVPHPFPAGVLGSWQSADGKHHPTSRLHLPEQKALRLGVREPSGATAQHNLFV